jgi:16S rRNA (guanine966-N2)-methyltransferase
MRIVAGRHRGRAIEAPPGAEIRPTGDRTRQALFNILEHGSFAASGSPIAGRRVLDAFAGTGALGLEALSRGAAHATFLESNSAARKAIAANAAKLGESDRISVLRGDATAPPHAVEPVALAFLDAPYGKGLSEPAVAALARTGWLTPDALVVVEVAADEKFASPAGFAVELERRYGAARIVILRRGDQSSQA